VKGRDEPRGGLLEEIREGKRTAHSNTSIISGDSSRKLSRKRLTQGTATGKEGLRAFMQRKGRKQSSIKSFAGKVIPSTER